MTILEVLKDREDSSLYFENSTIYLRARELRYKNGVFVVSEFFPAPFTNRKRTILRTDSESEAVRVLLEGK